MENHGMNDIAMIRVKKIATILKVKDSAMYHSVMDTLLTNQKLSI